MAGRRARHARSTPSRARSQHFIRDRRLAAEIVRDAGVSRDDLVLDIGAGTGVLTAELARRARRVVAIEVDPRLAAKLRGRWPNVDVVHGDVLEVALPREPFRVVANLPFHAATAILRRLLDDPHVPLERADVIVEWGVAFKRAVPWPSTRLSATWGAWYALSIARRVEPQQFRPPPSVDAAVLVAERRATPLVRLADWRAYSAFVAAGYRRAHNARDRDAHEWARMFALRRGGPRRAGLPNR